MTTPPTSPDGGDHLSASPSKFLSATVDTLKRKSSKAKRRSTFNLVNPASPHDFSFEDSSLASGKSMSASPEKAAEGEAEGEVEVSPRRPFERETTPANQVSGGIGEVGGPASVLSVGGGVRGILRPTGTPGSGNGVRFGQKNRFRVITPNNSQSEYVPTPPRSARHTLFASILSVVPMASPLRFSSPAAAAPAGANGDVSWEVPGEEGEVSLISASMGSMQEHDEGEVQDGDEEEEEELALPETPWSGVPEVHSSPLALPLGDSSRDISVQDIGAPSLGGADANASTDSAALWAMPGMAGGQRVEDVSNLLSTSFDGMSAGMSGMSGMGMGIVERSVASFGEIIGDESEVSAVSPGARSDDDNPTIRRRLSLPVHREDAVQRDTSGGVSKQASTLPSDESSSELNPFNPPIARTPIVKSPSAAVSPAPHATSPLSALNRQASPSSSSPLRSHILGRGGASAAAHAPSPLRFTSIFADMSMEQAEHAWPLRASMAGAGTSAGSGTGAGKEVIADGGDTSLGSLGSAGDSVGAQESASLDEPSSPSPAGAPAHLHTRTPGATSGSRTVLTPGPINSIRAVGTHGVSTPTPKGDLTAYYDAASFFTPCPPRQAGGTSTGNAALILAPTASSSSSAAPQTSLAPSHTLALLGPTQAVFDAHADHSTALLAELDAYRALTRRLQGDVEERDRALVDVKVRLVEVELRAAAQAQAQVSVSPSGGAGKDSSDGSGSESAQRGASAPLARRSSRSPDKLARADADADADAEAVRAQAQAHAQAQAQAQGQIQDLEIRLHKALSDQAQAERRAEGAENACERWRGEVEGMARAEREADVRLERERVKGEREREADRGAVCDVERMAGELKLALGRAQEELAVARREKEEVEGVVGRAEGEVSEMRDEVRGVRERNQELKARLRDAQRDVECARADAGEAAKGRQMAEHDTRAVRAQRDEQSDVVDQLRARVKELEASLQQAQGEAQRLRAESASKDLEISTLTRRKGELKEDREMLNIALDSKQQEVELLKRKLARATTAAATPGALALGSSMATTTTTATPLPPLGMSTTRANRLQYPDTVARTPAPGARRAVEGVVSASVAAASASASVNETGKAAQAQAQGRKYGSVRSDAAPQTATKRRSSNLVGVAAAGQPSEERENLAPQMQTPLVQNGKSARHGVQLYASTQVKDRVLRRQAIS